MAIPRILEARAQRGIKGNQNTAGSYYYIPEGNCPYCDNAHLHSYNCIGAYKVAKCKITGEHYKIVLD